MTESSGHGSRRLGRIWAIIEAQKAFPCMVVVTNAVEQDDRQSIARALAELGENAERRVGLLELGKADGSSSAASRREFAYLQYDVPQRGSQCEAFDAAAASWRAIYDVVIVSVALLSHDVLGAHIARAADSVVVGVRADRRVTARDRELKALLAQLGVSPIAVVETAPVGLNSKFAPIRMGQMSWLHRLSSVRLLRSLRSLLFPAREP